MTLMFVMASVTMMAAQSTPSATLRSITVSSRGGEVVVTIAGVGALARPKVGVLQDPARIYLDFTNVGMGSVPREIASTDAPVVRVRVAMHSSLPTTRVVIDLAAAQPHRVEMDASSVRVIIGRTAATIPTAAATPTAAAVPPSPNQAKLPTTPPPVGLTGTWSDIPRVPALAPPPADSRLSPAAVAPVRPASPPPSTAPATTYAPLGPPPPAADLERYRKQYWGTLYRLRLQQPLLMSLDAGETQAADRMQMAVAEFERLHQDLAAIKPPETVAAYHAMLVQSSTIGLMAFTLRFDAFRTGDPATIRNASSAAAGAILLIERACSVVQCPALPGAVAK
jgi:hypothetical protein